MYVSIPIWCDYKQVVNTKVSGTVAFQFQYGAIISFEPSKIRVCFSPFQFQYGAIISIVPSIVKFLYPGFNSNMVRL